MSKSNGVLKLTVAEGSEYERALVVSLPRGRYARGIVPDIMISLGPIEQAQNDVTKLGEAMKHIFAMADFFDRIFPVCLGLIDPKTMKPSKEDAEWIDMLTDMDIFEAYAEAASFVASNGQSEQVEQAVKKSKAVSEKAAAPA